MKNRIAKFYCSFVMINMMLVLSGCYQFETIDQPATMLPSGTLEINITVGFAPMPDDFPAKQSYYSILLPTNWESEESIAYSGTLEGMYQYSSLHSDTMESQDPAPYGYSWMTFVSSDTVDTLSGQISFIHSIQTNDSEGLYFLDYRLGYTGQEDYSYYSSNGHPTWIGTGTFLIEGDIYVDPNGTDSNAGLSPLEPLKTITAALYRTDADSGNSRKIIIGNGTYSASENGERFPFELKENLSLIGESSSGVLLDAEQQHIVIVMDSVDTDTIRNMTITGGACCEFEGRDGLWGQGRYEYGGGGIYINHSQAHLENLIITENASDLGGGISARESSLTLSNITIAGNAADLGGGIYNENSAITFSAENRSDIYLNTADHEMGSEIYSTNFLEVVVDTFTVMNPTDYYCSPLALFSFDIQNEYFGVVSADLYVNPTSGNDQNNGLSPEMPLRTLFFATNKIFSSAQNNHSIYLADGIYSPSSNGETFPVRLSEFVSLRGASRENVILDAEGENTVVLVENCGELTIKNVTISGGNGILQNTVFPNTGGGIHCAYTNITLENVSLYNNAAEKGASLYFCASESSVQNVSIINNSAIRWGGAIRSLQSNLNLDNVLMAGNSADRGAAMSFYNSECLLKNCTVTGNVAREESGSIWLAHGSSVGIINSILWDNMPYEMDTYDDEFINGFKISHSNICPQEEINLHQGDTLDWDEGNFTADPLFVDPASGNFALQEGSPCVDAGTAFFVWGNDTVVNIADTLYNGIAPDIGAIESQFTHVGLNDVELVPDKFILRQNYPNPFNPTTTIQYGLPEDLNVSLVIYDVKGKVIQTLESGAQSPGWYEVVWYGETANGKSISTGIYFARLVAGEYNKVIKMLYLK